MTLLTDNTNMKLNIALNIWISILAIGGFLLFYIKFVLKSEIPVILLILYGLFCIQFPLIKYSNQNKINKMKREFKINRKINLEELEKIRIEKDYQENFVRKLGIK